MLAMSGRVTMLGISRWTGTGGSYRTMLRFFHTVIPWATLFWLFFRKHLFRANEIYLLAGDEVVVSKSGKQTYGLDRFFSSLISKPISGLSFFTLSLVSVEERHSFPVQIEQVIKSDVEKLVYRQIQKSKSKENVDVDDQKGVKTKRKQK
jgi:IS4 transposase